jgi:hypothetical protein
MVLYVSPVLAYMWSSPGYHNTIITACVCLVGIFIFQTIRRIVDSITILKSLPTSTIAYLPKCSLAVTGLTGVVGKHVTEYIILAQQAPPPRRLDVTHVTGHLDAITMSSDRELRMEIVGLGSCRVFINVPTTTLARYITVLTTTGRRDTPRQPLLLSDQVSAEAILLNECDWASVASDGAADIPITSGGTLRSLIAIVQTETLTEITLAADEILNVVLQLLILRDGTLIEVKGVYMQSEECSVCYERPPETVLLPCRHSSMCRGCLNQLRESKCIVCRHQFTEFIQTQLES